ncbi:FecR family protein [Sinomicrobium oceani]|uniref:FecR family protein n=1 Tax=Sinomicrobium oceani TaxID=1150368 RepID=A0A1K1MS36_9FLAO|nr:FecR domain-containing protein [Sinomicrobium oceani]SFW24774.1 FecR family protein [Sinomicrobium oceani]
MNRKELLQFIAKQGDADFRKEVMDWIGASPENRAVFNRIKAEQVASFRHEHETDVAGEFRKFLSRTRRSRQFYTKMVPAAAIAIIAVLVSALFIVWPGTEKPMLYVAKSSEQKEFKLADGSTIFLNSESSLEISPQFNKDTRTVKLHGEAFFDVARNEAVPFIVETANGVQVRVLGTSFNVRSYPETETIETTLVSGKVEIYDYDNPDPAAILAPKQKAVFRKKQKDIRVEKVVTDVITSWKEGILTFDNTPLNSVIKDIERWYGITVHIEDPDLEDYTFSGKFRKQYDIIQVMDILQTSSPIHYDYDKNKNQVSLKKRR